MRSPNMFHSPAQARSLAFYDELLALPTTGGIWSQIKTAFSNWADASVRAEAESRLWDAAQADPRIMAELVQSRVGPETEVLTLAGAPINRAPASHATATKLGWGSMLEHAYQTRFHRNTARHA